MLRRTWNQSKKDMKQRIIGLVPAAGKATRLFPLPFSKELYPIGHMRFKGHDDLRPKAVCIYLLEKMKNAGIKDVYIILRKGKWDIPAFLGDGSLLDMNFAYLMMNLPFGVPYTVNQAFPFTHDAIVAFGFPDIIFQPENAFNELLDRHKKSKADIVLGLFPVDMPDKFHMVESDPDGRVKKIVINPQKTQLKYTWIIAVWSQTFSNFLQKEIKDINKKNGKEELTESTVNKRELQLSDIIQKAIDSNLNVEGVIFPQGSCLDIGTIDDLTRALNQH
jgi:glucose-1-phosphate thymidylyltransferase